MSDILVFYCQGFDLVKPRFYRFDVSQCAQLWLDGIRI